MCEKAEPYNTLKMSGCTVDVRLRRQNHVSGRGHRLRQVPVTPPKHQRQSSWHGSRGENELDNGNTHLIGPENRAKSVSNLLESSSLFQSANENQNGPTISRPLIHHQRHNLKNRFQLLKTLGEGTYGKVKLASDRSTGEQVAIKYIKKTKIHDDNDLARIRREIQILSNLRHKHIVNIREVFEKKDKIVLVMDYAQGGELYDYLNKMGRLSEWDARRIFRQIVSAIHYCHQNGVVHRDLKLENIILDDQGNVKIADFGLANYYSHNDTLRTYCGSPLYASPEIVNGKPYHGPEVDVWSLGVVLYTLVYGAMPFEASNLVSLKQQISEGDYKQPAKPSDAAGLIRHMLTVTASRRASMEDALRHWWVNFGHSTMPNDSPYSVEDDELSTNTTSPSLSSPSSNTLCLSCTDGNKAIQRATNTSTAATATFIIHQHNQSSISSDSDVEIDLRSNLRTNMAADRDGELKSCDISTPSEGQSSSRHFGILNPSEIMTSGDGNTDVYLQTNFGKLPPEVLEILKGSSSQPIASLLGLDKISTGFDLDQEAAATSFSEGGKLCLDGQDVDKTAASVFDSERKPKRSILKRRGKFSGGDSGCVMQESMVPKSEDQHVISKMGHLPRRLPSFRGEAHGLFGTKQRPCLMTSCEQAAVESGDSCIHAWSSSNYEHKPLQSFTHSQQQFSNDCNNSSNDTGSVDNHMNHTLYQQSQPTSVVDYALSQTVSNNNNKSSPDNACIRIPSNLHHQQQQSAKELPYLYAKQSSPSTSPPSSSSSFSFSTATTPSTPSSFTSPTSPPLPSFSITNGTAPNPAIKDFPSVSTPALSNSNPNLPTASFLTSPAFTIIPSYPCRYIVADGTNTENPKVTRRPKSILKNATKGSPMDQARNRLSISSIGSNSSADILDLSYDSGDSDHFINQLAMTSDLEMEGALHSASSSLGGDEGPVSNYLPLADQFQKVGLTSEGVKASDLEAPRNNSLNSPSRQASEEDNRAIEESEGDSRCSPIFLEEETSLLFRLARESGHDLKIGGKGFCS